MKIKNTIPDSVKNDEIIGIALLLLFFLVMLIFSLWLCTEFNPGMSIIESIRNADISTKITCSIELASFILSIFFLINQIQARIYANNIAYNLKDFIDYIDFFDNKMVLSYLNPKVFKEIYYNDISSMELIIDTYDSYSKYGVYPRVEGMRINITSDSDSYSIYYSPVNFDKLYKIIFYSQYIENFSYILTGDSKKMKKELNNSINKCIANNYKKPRFSLFKFI